jgi:hypothetical protein
MDEKPKSIWKKSWTGWRGLLLGWLILMTVLLVFFFILLAATGTPVAKSDNELWLLGVIGIGVTLIFLLAAFIRWVCCWRNFKRFLFGLACFATLIALFYAEEDWRGKHDWEKFKREWEAKGEHFDFKDFIPPPVPDDQNFAMTPIAYSSYGNLMTRDGKIIPFAQRKTNWVDRLQFDLGDVDLATNGIGYWAKGTLSDLTVFQTHYRELAAKTNLFAVPPQPQMPAQDVLLALSKYDSTIEELRRAAELPEGRFPLNYDNENPAEILLPHLAALKRSSRILQIRAIAELQNGQSDKALADVLLSMRLSDFVRDEPTLISQLVRIAMTDIAMQPVYEGLAKHEWSEAQLATLDSELAKQDFLQDFNFGMRCERAFSARIIDYLGRKNRYQRFCELFGVTWNMDDFSQSPNAAVKMQAAAFSVMPAGWLDQNKLSIAQMHEKFLLHIADPENHLVKPEIVSSFDPSKETATPYNLFGKFLLPALGTSSKRFAREQAVVDLARTAIALERCRLAHGEFPESLDALAPQFVAQIPHDVIGGQPLKYRRTDDGQFVLYSVGWNETDDGGAVVFKKGSGSSWDESPSRDVEIEQGDWVWRYPAK